MVILDTDVLLIEFRFQRDEKYSLNNHFLSNIKTAGGGITVFTLMEFLGNISYNIETSRLIKWQSWLRDAYNLAVIWPRAQELDADSFIRTILYDTPLLRMSHSPMNFMDALIINLAEQVSEVEAFVTWNSKHFTGKTFLVVKSPEEYLTSNISAYRG